jgi:hypothetical protein
MADGQLSSLCSAAFLPVSVPTARSDSEGSTRSLQGSQQAPINTVEEKGVTAERRRSWPIHRLEVPTVDRERSASSTSRATIAVNLSAPLSFKCIESQQSARSQKERIGRFRITFGLRE